MDCATRRSERREIASGVTSIARPAPFEHDRLIAAFVGRGSAQEADPSTFRELAIPDNGPVPLPDGPGPRVVLFYFSGQTGQVVKHAAVEADGYVLDHRNVDLAALAGVSRDAARSESGSGSAFPGGHQSTHRARLAVLTACSGKSGLDVLRGRRLHRQESVVAGDAGRRAVPLRLERKTTSREPYGSNVNVAAPIREAATAFVNGRRAGTVWAPPFRVDVTDLLRDGLNDIRIDVYNTAINQLAEGGRLPDVAAVTERYGQRFRLQDLDNLQPIPSGILTVPRLVLER